MTHGHEILSPQVSALRAGLLSARLEGATLRYISYKGQELVRAVQFAMRGTDWQTYDLDVRSMLVREDAAGFNVSIAATTGPTGDEVQASISITGSPDGRLTYTATAKACRTVLTNRTGIVVLHPLTISGEPVVVGTCDGGEMKSIFPTLIEPYPPFQFIRSLRYEVGHELSVAIQLKGEIFEMEDQRNWSDASFKTYSRPIAAPRPYLLEDGEVHTQTFELDVATLPGEAQNRISTRDHASANIRVGDATNATMPLLGLSVDDVIDAGRRPYAAALKSLKPGYLVATVASNDPTLELRFRWFAFLADTSGCKVVVELILACEDELRHELEVVHAHMRRTGLNPEAVFISPVADMKAVLPGSPWPSCPPLQALYLAGRDVFGETLIGGGTLAFFTELNRKRPDLSGLDFISFTTCPIVHAADDESVMETIACLPHIAHTVRAIFPDVPYWIGPSSIAARMNPYGDATVPNASGSKIPLTHHDVRQHHAFAAAWALGYIAAFAMHGAERIALSTLTGERGVAVELNDELRLSDLGNLLSVLYRFAGQPLLQVDVDGPRDEIAVLAIAGKEGKHLWIANLTERFVRYVVEHASGQRACVDLSGYQLTHIVLEPI